VGYFAVTSEFSPNLFEFGDIAGNGAWLDGHYRQHLRYNDVLAGQTPPIIINVYPILVVQAGELGRKDWLNSHENWHELVRPFANITSIDLSDVDLSDPNKFYEWMDLHNQEHAALDQAFGVG
jgi:hypothetical protein